MEATFHRDLAELPSIFTMVQRFCVEERLSEDERKTAAFILEELFTNMVKYGAASDDEIRVRLAVDPGQLTLAITDCNADRFDPRDQPDVDVNRPTADRTPGGLGIHLVRQFADSIDYHYANRHSTITISRRLH
jgi:serine/threonine-protein kinase RsbW